MKIQSHTLTALTTIAIAVVLTAATVAQPTQPLDRGAEHAAPPAPQSLSDD